MSQRTADLAYEACVALQCYILHTPTLQNQLLATQAALVGHAIETGLSVQSWQPRCRVVTTVVTSSTLSASSSLSNATG